MVQANEYPRMDPLTSVVLRMEWKMDMVPGLIKEGLLKTRGYGKMGNRYLLPSKKNRSSARSLFNKSRSKPQVYYSVGKEECAPSQNGPFAECLQLQKATFLGSVISTF